MRFLPNFLSVSRGVVALLMQERPPIWPQFKYDQFIREQFDKKPEMTFEQAVSNWNKLKEQ